MRTKDFIRKYHRLLFYTAWFILQLIQARNTELFDDEAYYWVYSQFPAWGYFDHPPMIAVLIRAGYFFFHNELGVRLFTIILSTAALYIADLLTERKNPMLFYAICASMAIAQIGGILAVPDAPLMFFIALFFLAYRRLVNNMNLANSVLLGLIIALMFYTKYHALLVVLFTALSNPKLFRHYHAYVACLVALLLFMPHLIWQHNNGYPSLQFHLFERNAADPKIWYPFEFILGQVLLAGPFVGWMLIAAALFYRPVNITERALKFSFIGVYIFFFISTFRGKAEANWTIPAFIGLIVLSHQYLISHYKLRKLLYRMLPLTLIPVIVARIIMMADLPPAWWIVKDEFHENKVFAKKISALAKDNSVVFLDTYQKPSKYWFYSGDTAFGLNTPTYRRNNFNFWPLEEHYNGKPAYVFGAYDNFFNEGFMLRSGDKNGGRLVPLYFSFSKIRIGEINATSIDSNRISVRFTTHTPSSYMSYTNQQPYDTASICLAVYRKDKVVRYIPSNIKVKDITGHAQQHLATFDLGDVRGKYICKLGISTCLPGRPSLNSSGFDVVLK